MLGGSFATVRIVTAVLPRAENFTSASFLSHIRRAPFPFVFFLAFSLARISATAVSKLFLCLAVKGCAVYIRVPSENRRRRAKAHPPSSLELRNLADPVDCEWFSHGLLSVETLLVHLCDDFFRSPVLLSASGIFIQRQPNIRTQYTRKH